MRRISPVSLQNDKPTQVTTRNVSVFSYELFAPVNRHRKESANAACHYSSRSSISLRRDMGR
jgi:hypothetical protein